MKNLLALIILCTLVACGKDEGEKKAPEPIPTPAPPAPEQPSVEQALDAALRGHPHAMKVCYDSKSEGLLIQYSPHVEPPAQDTDGMMHGWFYLKVNGFYPSANGTWYLTNQPDGSYVQVYPDDTSLPCKAR